MNTITITRLRIQRTETADVVNAYASGSMRFDRYACRDSNFESDTLQRTGEQEANDDTSSERQI